ncbi:MAG: tetratricopeptide repeat protein, partial [Planctomycetota bacterium]
MSVVRDVAARAAGLLVVTAMLAWSMGCGSTPPAPAPLPAPANVVNNNQAPVVPANAGNANANATNSSGTGANALTNAMANSMANVANTNANATANANTNRNVAPPANTNANTNRNVAPPTNANANTSTNSNANRNAAPPTNTNSNSNSNANAAPPVNATNTNTNSNSNRPPVDPPPVGPHVDPPPPTKFDKAAALKAALEEFRAIESPADPAARADRIEQLMQLIDGLTNDTSWQEVGHLLAQQADARANQPVFELINAVYQINSAGNPDAPEAVAAWERVKKLADVPGFAWPLRILAGFERARGRTTEALQLLDRALAIRPGFIEALRMKAIIFAEKSRLADAAAVVESIIALKPPSLVSELYLLAVMQKTERIEQLLAGGISDPLSVAQAHVWLSGNNPDVAAARLHLQDAIGFARAARPSLSDQRKANETIAQAHLLLARNCFMTEPTDQATAFSLLHDMRVIDPTDQRALGMLVQFARSAQNTAEATFALLWLLDEQTRVSPSVALYAGFVDAIVVLESADKASEVPRPAVWAMIGKDLAASSEPTTEESGIVMQLLKLLVLAAENPATGYPQPIEASRLAGVSPEAFEHVIDWLLARSGDKAFQVRLPAMDLLGLLVGCTGAREEPFV